MFGKKGGGGEFSKLCKLYCGTMLVWSDLVARKRMEMRSCCFLHGPFFSLGARASFLAINKIDHITLPNHDGCFKCYDVFLQYLSLTTNYCDLLIIIHEGIQYYVPDTTLLTFESFRGRW